MVYRPQTFLESLLFVLTTQYSYNNIFSTSYSDRIYCKYYITFSY